MKYYLMIFMFLLNVNIAFTQSHCGDHEGHSHEKHETHREQKRKHSEGNHQNHDLLSKQKITDKKEFHSEDSHKEQCHSEHEEHVHKEHSSHEGHEEHEDLIRLSDRDIKNFDIQIELAKSGNIQSHISLMGEVVPNANQEAHITPRFTGLVTKVLKEQGDYVQEGEVLALIEANDSLNTYELKSLIEGTILKKHISVGEVHGGSLVAFLIANLNMVWVNLHVYQKDLAVVQKGSEVFIKTREGLPHVKGVVSYVSPIIDEKTRTSIARVEIDNRERFLRPGMFVEAQLFASRERANIVIPKKALQIVEGRLSVFIQDEEGFKPVPVKVNRQNEEYIEVVSGLEVGQKYVSNGAFILKSDLSKTEFKGCSGH